MQSSTNDSTCLPAMMEQSQQSQAPLNNSSQDKIKDKMSPLADQPIPASQASAQSEKREAPQVEGTDVLPGYWAHKVKNCEWRLGIRHSRRPGTLLFELRNLLLAREPTVKNRNRLNCTWPWDGDKFWDFLDRKKANIEATLAQSTGRLLTGDEQCHQCQFGHGMFSGCVEVPGMKHCASCHVGGQMARCSRFRKRPPTKKRVFEEVSDDSETRYEAWPQDALLLPAASKVESVQLIAPLYGPEGPAEALQSAISERVDVQARLEALDNRIAALQNIMKAGTNK